MTVHRVRARNAATASENRIHADDVAREYGFSGGLVPGVTVYAYLTRPVVETFGRDWLAGGFLAVRFRQPFYEGDVVSVTLDGDDLVAINERGEVCATGSLTPAVALSSAAADPWAVESMGKQLAAWRERSRASAATLAPGTVLAALRLPADADALAAHLDEVDDDLALYRDEKLAHPGWLLRAANAVLVANVRLGPWIHVGSDVRHLGLVHAGDDVVVCARVEDRYERKGHAFVELDVLLAVGDEPVAAIRHTAIYEPARRGMGA
jgi:acyl dehydratase